MQPQAREISLLEGIKPELGRVEEEMYRLLKTDDRLLAESSTHLLKGGGKRLRPALVILSAGLFGPISDAVISVAAAAEIIHMATLVHDDVVDDAGTRRGIPTINARWSADLSILLGDYLFATAFSTLAATGDNRVVRIMADVVFQMCSGEIRQMEEEFDARQSEEDYLRRIEQKTAYFIAECCHLGGLLGGASDAEAQALRRYGNGLGMGFQIVDDILDFQANVATLGKPVGSDLRSGVITLPVIHALVRSDDADLIRSIITKRSIGDEEVEQVTRALEAAGSFDYAYRLALKYVRDARESLASLPQVPTLKTLETLTEFVLKRDF